MPALHPKIREHLVPGVGRILADVRPVGEPFLSDLVAFLTQPVHEGGTAVKLRRTRQLVDGLFSHLDRAHDHVIVAEYLKNKILVFLRLKVRPPSVDPQNKIKLFVQRQIAHQFVLSILDFRIGLAKLWPFLRIDAQDPDFVRRILVVSNELANGWIL